MSIKQLIIIHDLPEHLLMPSIKALQEITKLKNIKTVEKNKFLETYNQTNQEDDLVILVLHLDLKNEIINHELISNHAKIHSFKELNSYNKISKLFDNKFDFYKFMLANDIEQLKTELIDRDKSLDTAKQQIQDFINNNNLEDIILKPCHGTESRDQLILGVNFTDAILKSYLDQVLQYDSILIQEYMHDATNTKFLIYDQNIVNKNINQSEKNIFKDFNDALLTITKDLPKLYSIDILENSTKKVILEANSRPAAIYKYL